MDSVTRQEKLAALARLRDEADSLEVRIGELEGELGYSPGQADWRDSSTYYTYEATTGFFLGMAGAITSLLSNVVGSIAVGQHPLKIIQLYLTFGLGERALDNQFNNSMMLLIGCCLYVATGMVYGALFQMLMAHVPNKENLFVRLVWSSLLGLALWLLNYYGVLSWLQPLLFGGRWIVDQVPWYVGAGTHLVFAWTMAVLYPLGVFSPYRMKTEQQ